MTTTQASSYAGTSDARARTYRVLDGIYSSDCTCECDERTDPTCLCPCHYDEDAETHLLPDPSKYALGYGKDKRYSEDQARNPDGTFAGGGQGGGAAGAHPVVTSSGAIGTGPNGQLTASDTAKLVGQMMNGGKITISSDQLPLVLSSMKAGIEPVNLEHAQIAGPGNENLFAKTSLDAAQTKQLSENLWPDKQPPLEHLPREAMPVIPSDAETTQKFADFLGAQGLKAEYTTLDPRQLTATQDELNGVKVAQIHEVMKSDPDKIASQAIVVDRNGAVLDGHHRWAAEAAYAVTHPDFKVPVLRVDTDIATLLTAGEKFDQAQGIEHKPFGATRTLRSLGKFTERHEFGRPPAGEQPPDPNKPYLWFDGQWILLATDDGDGVPRKLTFPPAPSTKNESDARMRILRTALRYSEDQPRDDHGRFGSGDGSTQDMQSSVATLNASNGKVDPATVSPELRSAISAWAGEGETHSEAADINANTDTVRALLDGTEPTIKPFDVDTKTAAALGAALNASDHDSPELYRGVSFQNGDPALSKLVDGGSIHIGVSSFSSEKGIGERYALADVKGEVDFSGTDHTAVLFDVTPGGHGLNIAPLVTSAQDREWVTGGNYKIDKVDSSELSRTTPVDNISHVTQGRTMPLLTVHLTQVESTETRSISWASGDPDITFPAFSSIKIPEQRYSEDQPRDDNGRFEGGGQLDPLKGGGGVGKSGKELMSIANSASLSTLPAAETKNGTLAERSLATLSKYVGESVPELSQHTYELVQQAIKDDEAKVPWDNRTGKFNSGDARTAVEAGMAWYHEAHDFAAGKSDDPQYNADFARAGFTPAQGAAITAALSPQQSWEANMAGMKALTAAFANPDRQLTQDEADKLNTAYHSGSLGSFQTQDGRPWDKQTMGDPMKASGTGPRTQQETAVWVPVKNTDGTPFEFRAGMSMGDLMSGKLDPPGTPLGATGAVAIVGLNQSVRAGGSGYRNIEKAVQLANGKSIDETVQGAKVRSFFNCMNDPETGADPVIDSHMIEGMAIGSPPAEGSVERAATIRDHMTPIMEKPTVAGTSIGCYPALADAVRDATEKLNSEQPGAGPGAMKMTYNPAQVQAIAWLQQIHQFPNGVTGGGKRGGKGGKQESMRWLSLQEHRASADKASGPLQLKVLQGEAPDESTDSDDVVPVWDAPLFGARILNVSDVRHRILIFRYSEDQPRDDHGRFGSGDGGGTATQQVAEPIRASELASYPSKEVSHEEFQKAAADGKSALEAIQADKRVASENPTVDTDDAYKAVQESWGGAAIDPTTGKAKDFDSGFAVTIGGPNSTVELPETATKEEFDKAVSQATDKFADKLQGKDTYFGVFHDDNKKTIDIDPVAVVNNQKDAENIAAFTHSVGGAYDFSTGNGVFPPHVAD
jgi:hypothetical protein